MLDGADNIATGFSSPKAAAHGTARAHNAHTGIAAKKGRPLRDFAQILPKKQIYLDLKPSAVYPLRRPIGKGSAHWEKPSAIPKRTKGTKMSLKLKVLGFGLLAVMATGALAAMNASASVTGHFTHDAATNHATVVGTENFHTVHSLSFQRTAPTGTNSGAPIICTNASYHGLAPAKTVDVLQVTPTYSGCLTTGDGAHGSVVVHTNGCSYTFRSNSNASIHKPTEHATVTVDCPAGKAIVITHPNCEITVGPQALKGVTYTTTLEGKHSLTVNVTVSHIAGQFHGGLCVFLGTSQIFDMNGAVTVKGFDTAGNQVNITAT